MFIVINFKGLFGYKHRLSNWDIDQTKDYVASFTLPRRVELNSDKNAILTPPIEAVTQLRIQELDSVGAAKGNLVTKFVLILLARVFMKNVLDSFTNDGCRDYCRV